MGSLFYIQFEDVIQIEEFDISLKLFHVAFLSSSLRGLQWHTNTCPNLKCASDSKKHCKHVKQRKSMNKVIIKS